MRSTLDAERRPRKQREPHYRNASTDICPLPHRSPPTEASVEPFLRGEGLYSSHIDAWRRAVARGDLSDSPGQLPGSSKAGARENERLRAENARLTAELAKSEAIVEILGKTYAFLEMVTESADSKPKTIR
jgi:hypothetical protein